MNLLTSLRIASAMNGFSRNAEHAAMFANVSLSELAKLPGVQTPCYVYDLDGIFQTAEALRAALPEPHLIAYAMKANSSGTIIRGLAARGLGADCVSAGELQLALACGINPKNIVFSGVGKTDEELSYALNTGIKGIHVESIEELERLESIAAQLQLTANVALRINPSVQAQTIAHIATGHATAKFGLPKETWPGAKTLLLNSKYLRLVGLTNHVGSMLTQEEDYLNGAKVVVDLAIDWRPEFDSLEYLDFGGGFGTDYGAGKVPTPASFAALALSAFSAPELKGLHLVVEPGRSLVASFGCLLSKVIQPKVASHHRWLVIDAAMNDLIRPALYSARHRIETVEFDAAEGDDCTWTVVGPICESTDKFGDYALGERVSDHVVIRDAGAYGFSLASEYNARALAQELYLSGGQLVHKNQSSSVAEWVQRRLES